MIFWNLCAVSMHQFLIGMLLQMLLLLLLLNKLWNYVACIEKILAQSQNLLRIIEPKWNEKRKITYINVKKKYEEKENIQPKCLKIIAFADQKSSTLSIQRNNNVHAINFQRKIFPYTASEGGRRIIPHNLWAYNIFNIAQRAKFV